MYKSKKIKVITYNEHSKQINCKNQYFFIARTFKANIQGYIRPFYKKIVIP